MELEKPRVQGKAGDFAELLRASVLHSSSAWGLWAQRRNQAAEPKAFLSVQHRPDTPGSEMAGTCDDKTDLLTYMSAEWELFPGINSSLSENKRLHIWGRVCLPKRTYAFSLCNHLLDIFKSKLLFISLELGLQSLSQREQDRKKKGSSS